ncbi:MAG: hypothetical protein JNK30_22655 [Phenylobacterium sp.]|uniref:hypothetical protein n=1 Tax=Phenylobacterium sp. TaxID=1871053 RepID=UPI001A615623|nr:hypothetical protein [Phenylobacterium sp.]MBL8774207.1 hypothetical protein [Phenylobacterium sp.]
MRKYVVSALAAIMAAGPVLAVAGPADAGDRRHYYRHHHRGGGGNDVAVAAIAGIAGLALGAALSDNDRRSPRTYSRSYSSGYRYDPYYDSYYGGYYPRDRRICVTRERVWDPYIGRHVKIQREYPC